MIRKKSLVTEG